MEIYVKQNNAKVIDSEKHMQCARYRYGLLQTILVE